MSELLLTLVNRSLAACWLVLAILFLRPLLRKVSSAISCALWSLVAVRLLCPFSIQSVLSLIPSAQPIPTDFATLQPTVVDGGASTVGQTIGTPVFPTTAPAGNEAASSVSLLPKIAAAVWIVGIAAFIAYLFGSYLRLRLQVRVREAVKQEGGFWLCDRIDAPFVMGMFRPRILVPYTVEKKDLPYILAHEKAHLARHDHWRKAIGFLLLAVFWFQPLLWIAFFLLCRDIEFACDERVIRSFGADAQSKKDYAEALVRGTFPSMSVIACPLAFGGLKIKQRVHSVVKYRKPAVSLVLAATLVCAAVAVCFLTDPKVGADAPADVSVDVPEQLPPENETPGEENTVSSPGVNTASSWRDRYTEAEVIVTPIEPMIVDDSDKGALTRAQEKISYYHRQFRSSGLSGLGDPGMVLLYTNEGDADASVTYLLCDETVENAQYGFALVTILLPAAQKVAYDFGGWYGYVVIGASYDGMSVEVPLRAYTGG